jgi:YHS domain-containing protein
MYHQLMRVACFLLAFGAALTVSAAQPPIYQTAEGAIDGYDPVAYFVSNAPAKGNKAYSHKWNGADWYFANAENLEKFRADPEKYAPRYGGY